LKILQLISEKPPIKSGFSRVISNLSRELEKLGNEVDVMSAFDCSLKLIGEIKLVLKCDEIYEKLKKDYDIVNVHGHTPLFSDRLLILAKLLDKKVVYTLHCLADYQTKPISVIYNDVFNSTFLKLADVIIVSSKSYYDIINHNNKIIIPWGVDVERFSGEKLSNETYNLLFVGQMRSYKGINILLEAIKGLDLNLNIVGSGPMLTDYIKYSREIGLDNVVFHGNVSDKKLKYLYSISDVLVLPSIAMNEAFGLVTLEAASMRCAVIASDLPGIRDVVKDFGILVKPNDVESLRKNIILLKNKDIRNKCVTKGTTIISKYSWATVAKKYSNVYSHVLNS
jgi:rhamnosyl/mannosyltransferase